MSGFNLICCVVNMGDAEKTIQFAKKYGVKGGSVSIGRGTVHSRLLEVLGLNEVRKEVVRMLVSHELASEAIRGLGRDMQFEKPHHGIAFSMPVGELIGGGNELKNDSETDEVKNTMYKAIYVVVDRGNAEDVVEAANKAGARGATIFNARGMGNGAAQTLFKMEVVPEKEEVFIITRTETKDAIVAAVREHLNIDEPGNGMLFVMDVEEAYGLY